MNYRGSGNLVATMERAMRLSDEVIRYLTVLVKEPKPGDSSEDD
jgi:small subunit ribosomal protein S6